MDLFLACAMNTHSEHVLSFSVAPLHDLHAPVPLSLALSHDPRAVHKRSESARQKRGTLSAWVEIAMAWCEIRYGLKRRRERCFLGIRKRDCASVTFAGVDGLLHAPRKTQRLGLHLLCTCALRWGNWATHAPTVLSLPLDWLSVHSAHDFRKHLKSLMNSLISISLKKTRVFTYSS